MVSGVSIFPETDPLKIWMEYVLDWIECGWNMLDILIMLNKDVQE